MTVQNIFISRGKTFSNRRGNSKRAASAIEFITAETKPCLLVSTNVFFLPKNLLIPSVTFSDNVA